MVDLFQPEREKQKQKPLLNPPWHWTYSLRVAHVAALLQQFLVSLSLHIYIYICACVDYLAPWDVIP